MVRIIEVPANGRGDLPAQIEKRKEIIHKISIRSNQQNPIKRWNLVSNDDFQNDLARHFWAKRLYYERRQHEWKVRKTELEALRISRGPDIRWMMQLIASTKYDSPKLGPAVAQGQINQLFEEEPYSIIRTTNPEKAYQMYLLGEIMYSPLRRLRHSRRYIENLKTYIDLCLYSLVYRALSEGGIILGKIALNERLEQLWSSGAPEWDKPIQTLVDLIHGKYEAEKKKIWKKEQKELSVANYVKSRTSMGNLLEAVIPRMATKTLSAPFVED
jgi:hypothetical protein